MKLSTLSVVIMPAVFFAGPMQAAVDGFDHSHRATTSKPLNNWKAGFVSGNGNIGIIMSGEPRAEALIVNAKLYLPIGAREIVPDLSPYRDEFKRAGLNAGKDGPTAVHKMIVEKRGKKAVGTDPSHPAFVLKLGMRGNGGTSNYMMTEDFTNGELQVRWSDADGDWYRKVFVSRPDDMVVMSIGGPKGRVSCDIMMEIKHQLVNPEMNAEDGWLSSHTTYLKGKGGYDSLIKIVPTGGSMTTRGASVTVADADSITLMMKVKTWREPLPVELSESWAFSPQNPAFQGKSAGNGLSEMRRSMSALSTDYYRSLATHAVVHGALYRRVALDLGGSEERALSSEALLERAAKDGCMSKALAERLYNACRYLIICSTGETPPNLQGIWSGTWSPGWSGDYTLDSNLQLAVQSIMSCNLPELMQSYFDVVDSWLPDCRVNARKLFGFRGVAFNIRASRTCLLLPWGSWPGEQAAIGMGGWLLHFYYDYYRFTGDRDFLSKRFLPLAKEIALFYEDFLAGTEDANGKFRFYMGYSPEHGLSANATYDIAIAKSVFSTLIAAAKDLGIEQENIPKWQAMLQRMPPYLLNENGELKEWSWPGVGESPNHRHHSQFLPLYQFCEIDRDGTPELWRAADLAFKQKTRNWLHLEEGANSNHITHGMMNQGQCAARLGHGDIVYEVLSRMVTKQYVYPGFLISYWPGPKGSGVGFDPVGTIPDVLNNALIFAWDGTIDVLPALPKEWPTGSISGVLLRGQIQVQQLSWDIPARKVSLTLRSGKTQTVTLRFPPGFRISPASAGPPNCRTLTLTKGRSIPVEIAFTEAGMAR